MNRQTLMVINSDRDQTQAMRDCLEEAGYRVLTTGLGQSALEMIQHERPDLLLLEWKLPDLSGLAVIRMIRSDERSATLPIILRGMDMKEEDIMVGLETGADICLVEPFHPQVLVARVRSVMRRSYAE